MAKTSTAMRKQVELEQKGDGKQHESSKTTAQRLSENLTQKKNFNVKMEKNGTGEVIGFKLFDHEFEYVLDAVSMPYVLDKKTRSAYGLSKQELDDIINILKTKLNSEGKIFLLQNMRKIRENNFLPQDVFHGDKFVSYGLNIDGSVYWIQNHGKHEYFLIKVCKDSQSEKIDQNTTQQVLQTLEAKLDLMSQQGKEYFLQNKAMIRKSLIS